MLRDRTFNIAFLISAGWHFFCMLCFTVVVLPISLPMSKLSNVSFLGPILEKTAFELMLDKKVSVKRTSYAEGIRLDNIFLSHEEKTLGKMRFANSFFSAKKEKVKLSANDLFGDFKFTPPFRQVSLPSSTPGAELGVGRQNFFIEGVLGKRELLLKPEPPVISKKIEAQAQSFIVELKFKVSSSGKVEEVVLSASSGYPDVDLAAINYMKGFRFSPLSSPEGAPIWDKIKLNLKSR